MKLFISWIKVLVAGIIELPFVALSKFAGYMVKYYALSITKEKDVYKALSIAKKFVRWMKVQNWAMEIRIFIYDLCKKDMDDLKSYIYVTTGRRL